MCSVTRIKTEKIRGSVTVTELLNKIQEKRLLMKMDETFAGRMVRDLVVDGTRNRETPRRIFIRISEDLKEK